MSGQIAILQCQQNLLDSSQLLDHASDVRSLVLRKVELQLRGLPAAVGAGQRRGAVGRAAADRAVVVQPLPQGVPGGDEDHAVVDERRDGGEDGALAAAALRAGRREDGRALAHEGALGPQAPGAVQKRLELGAHGAKPGVVGARGGVYELLSGQVVHAGSVEAHVYPQTSSLIAFSHLVPGGEPKDEAIKGGEQVHVNHRDRGVLGRRVHLLKDILRQGLRNLHVAIQMGVER